MRDFRIYHRMLNSEEIEVLAGITNPEIENLPTLAAFRIPQLNEATLKQRAEAARLLPEDHSQPFLEINDHQLIINGQAGLIYLLEISSDLKQWDLLMRFQSESSRMVFEDPDRKLTPSQFFRVRVE